MTELADVFHRYGPQYRAKSVSQKYYRTVAGCRANRLSINRTIAA
jgi:hypothetical protein